MTVILTTGAEDRERVVDDTEGIEGAIAALGSEVCRKASTLRGPHLQRMLQMRRRGLCIGSLICIPC